MVIKGIFNDYFTGYKDKESSVVVTLDGYKVIEQRMLKIKRLLSDNNIQLMIKVDLDLGQSDWSSKDWKNFDMTMKAIERMLKIEKIFGRIYE